MISFEFIVRPRTWPGLWCLAGLLFISPTHVQTAEPNDATRQLHALFEREWEHTLATHPTLASRLGDRRWNDAWPDLSLSALDQQQEHRRQVLQEIQSIDRARLSSTDQLNYDLFIKDTQNSISNHIYGLHLIALNQRGGVQTENELADSLRFATRQDYEDWIRRLETFGVYMDQTIALLEEGIRRGMVLPQIILERIPKQIDAQRVSQPEHSPFYDAFEEMPDAWTDTDKATLRHTAKEAIVSAVLPAYERLATFMEERYLPAGLENVGAWQWPDGASMYAYLAGKFTTTDLSPQDIHQIGLDEVKRIRQTMETIKAQVGFHGTLQEFFEHLRTDPRYYYATGEELLAAYRAMSKRIDPLMVQIFKTLPRMPYGVEPIPDAIAPDTTTAYYRRPAADGSRAGSYFVNLYKPETRPKYEMMALSLHEAVPGHHLQIALAMELGQLPNFRRYGGFTAFVEGWGLYAEFLGEELGLYEDPYDKFGQLTYEMWRAIRLVVDTGMHAMKWTRAEAIQFFKDHAAKSEQDIVNEIDRYIAWPGQALAYKIGELKIKELRGRAEEAFGAKFDVREFHDVVLSQGAVPLDILEGNVEKWIRTQTAEP